MFFNEINKTQIAILSISSDVYICIFKHGGRFVAVKYKKLPDFKYNLDKCYENENLKELIEEIEAEVIIHGSSFINKGVIWKWEESSEKQKSACKVPIKNKDEAHKYFSRRNSYFALKELV